MDTYSAAASIFFRNKSSVNVESSLFFLPDAMENSNLGNTTMAMNHKRPYRGGDDGDVGEQCRPFVNAVVLPLCRFLDYVASTKCVNNRKSVPFFLAFISVPIIGESC